MRVRIPASLNEEDVFFSTSIIKLSMRQVVTTVGGILFWVGIAKYGVVPMFGFTFPVALFATVWIAALFFILAFVKIKQRPVDQYLGEKINFMFQPRTYVLRDNVDSGAGLEADLYNDADLDAMLETVQRPQAY